MTDAFGSADDSRTVYTVSRLNRECRFVLNECFGSLWIEGEISNFSSPSSGHLYFSLKDAEAQVRCAMFRPQARLLNFQPKNGDHVVLKAEVGLYEPRGDFQLVVETMEATGDGALLRAFEALKQRLLAEGLFDAARKRPFPTVPRCIGVMTSPTGAAIRDILSVLKRRFAAIPVVILPVPVQGPEAPLAIAEALDRVSRLKPCDVLILARGGGSLEDLWAFNEESVARAIHRCAIPVVAGIGHETDFTIADFVADLRAPTPSAAAEAVSPDGYAWLERFAQLELALGQAVSARLRRFRQTTGFLEKRLQQLHPARRLLTQAQRIDELEARLGRALAHGLDGKSTLLQTRYLQLVRHRPSTRIAALAAKREQLALRLRSANRNRLDSARQRLDKARSGLNAVSPLATLDRGYSITSRWDNRQVLRSCLEAPAPGGKIRTRLTDGELFSTVDCAKPDDPLAAATRPRAGTPPAPARGKDATIDMWNGED